MWVRTLLAIRRFSVDLGGHLASWRLSVALMVVAALYYAFLAIWATSSPAHVVQNIASLLPFWLVYALLLVNTAWCLWRRLPTLLRGPSRALVLGTFLFHGAFFLIATGFMLSLLFRQEARVWAAVGENYEGRPEQFLSQSPPKILVSIIDYPGFRVKDIRPEFWRDQLLFTTLEADLEFARGLSTTRINRPLWTGWGSFLRLSGFGYTPRYELLDREGRLIDSAFVKLNVFPPGQRDYFTVLDYPHRFYLEILPDFTLEEGLPGTRSLNLVDPGIVLRIFRGRLDLGGAILQRGSGFHFEGLMVQFPEIRYWGEFAIVRDPGAPVLFAGYLIGLAGLLLKLLRGRVEAERQPGGLDGSLWGRDNHPSPRGDD